jgi:hypothetical protein
MQQNVFISNIQNDLKLKEEVFQECERIAITCMNIETLEVRNHDSLDFHDVGVWQISAALRTAIEYGIKMEKNRVREMKSKRKEKIAKENIIKAKKKINEINIIKDEDLSISY